MGTLYVVNAAYHPLSLKDDYENSKARFHFSGQTSQFSINGTHKLSKPILARMTLLMDQSRSVLRLWSAKAWESAELWREKCTRAPWTFLFKLARTSSFGLARPDKWRATLVILINWVHQQNHSSHNALQSLRSLVNGQPL